MQPSPTRRNVLLGAGGLAAGVALSCRSAQEEDEAGKLDELFPEFTDQRGSLPPINKDERRARRERCGQLLAQHGYDAFLMEAGATMTYLSDVSWGKSERLFALVVLADGSHFWVSPAFESKRAQLRTEADGAPGGDILEWDEHEYPFAPVASELKKRGATRLAIEPNLRHRFAHGMSEALGHAAVGYGMDVLRDLRGVKDAHELQLMRRANELTQSVLVAVSERVETGMTSQAIGGMVSHAHARLGMGRGWNLTLIGPASAYPHGDGVNRSSERGDVLLIDCGGSLHGYQSDITRSWVIGGEPSTEVRQVWNVVRDAQRKAFEAIRPGALCRSIDAAARKVIDDAGYGPGYTLFGHRLGHGIGMEGHEDPYFDGGSNVVLKPGMTLSNEPGIYQYGKFGIRIEDIIVVTHDGADHFGTWQKGPGSPA